jgi:hypothetical protein
MPEEFLKNLNICGLSETKKFSAYWDVYVLPKSLVVKTLCTSFVSEYAINRPDPFG